MGCQWYFCLDEAAPKRFRFGLQEQVIMVAEYLMLG
jgi:hypothetical protein